MGEFLLDATLEDVADVLVDLVGRASFGGRQGRYRVAYQSLIEVLKAPEILAYDRKVAIYRRLREHGHDDLCRLFLEPSPAKSYKRPADRPSDVKNKDIPTLGERKSLARRSDRIVLERLLADPDPSVVSILLGNPTVIEGDVLKIASRRPCNPEVLEVIWKHRRWSSRYIIRKALVFNPYTPPSIGLKLLTFLFEGDLKQVADSPSLHKQIRHHSLRLVDCRLKF